MILFALSNLVLANLALANLAVIKRRAAFGFAIAVSTFATLEACRAETATLRIAKQFGISYLSLIVAQDHKLIEKAAVKAGLPEPKIEWQTVYGATAMKDMLAEGKLDMASSGIAPLILSWSESQGGNEIVGIAALCSMPNVLTTTKPEIKSLADFTDADRIALSTVKFGFQAQVLWMAADKQLGQFDKLDALTVSMPHPDGTRAMLTEGSQIVAHLTTPPFVQQQLRDPRIHKVLSSYDVLGGSHTFTVLLATKTFVTANPKTTAAIVAALDEANAWIKAHPAEAAKLYIAAEKSKLELTFVEAIIRDADNKFTTTPEKTQMFADFQFRHGLIKIKPKSWKNVFQSALHSKPGT